MPKPNGYVVFNGPSKLDGKPIVVVVTGFTKKSANPKTGGDLLQMWILCADMSPMSAVNSGADATICGNCIHRGIVVDGKNIERPCYVNVPFAPSGVWKAWKRGIYPTLTGKACRAMFKGRGVRLGAYGDPSAVPLVVLENLMRDTAFGTGYTHQWRDFPALAKWCMASADSEADRSFAKILGFRSFRVRSEADPVGDGEVVCPASKEAGHKTTCDVCKACGGNEAKAKADIVIIVHGAAGKVANYAKRRAA